MIEPFTISVGNHPMRFSFTLNKTTMRIVIDDTAVATMSRDEWLAVVAAFYEVYQREITSS